MPAVVLAGVLLQNPNKASDTSLHATGTRSLHEQLGEEHTSLWTHMLSVRAGQTHIEHVEAHKPAAALLLTWYFCIPHKMTYAIFHQASYAEAGLWEQLQPRDV